MEQYMELSAIGGLTLIEIERKLARIEAYEQNEKDLEYIIEEQAKQIKELEDRAYKAENRVEELEVMLSGLE